MELFKPGDWVDWAYGPRDPEGPYGYMTKFGLYSTELDPIGERLERYEPPPYLVERTFDVDPSGGHGHPQVVCVLMTPKHSTSSGKTGEQPRHFSGLLFKKVNVQ